MKRIISLAALLVLLIALGSVLVLKGNESIAICNPSKTSTPYCKFVGETTLLIKNIASVTNVVFKRISTKP